MARNISALIAGLVFGLGLTVSAMVNPAKVIGFLDITGDWDPSLAFVMAAGLIVTGIGYRLVLRQHKPWLEHSFHVPRRRDIDAPLALGAVLFGIGWGLAGLCPGPAIAALGYAGSQAFVFIAAMLVGVLAFDLSPLRKH